MPVFEETAPDYRSLRVGARIRACRKQKGWTLRDIAQQMSISIAALSAIENDRAELDLERLVEISDVLGVRPDALFPRTRSCHFHVVRRSSVEQVAPVTMKIRNLARTIPLQYHNVIRPLAAPFVGKTEAWVSLAMKRMIRYAAENGFDRVAFTTGEQQADRFDLSKHVKEIKYAKMLDGNGYYVQVTSHRGATIFDDTNVRTSNMEDIVGKEITKKIVETATNDEQYLRDLDLKVGGEGMKAFYDKMLVNKANAISRG